MPIPINSIPITKGKTISNNFNSGRRMEPAEMLTQLAYSNECGAEIRTDDFDGPVFLHLRVQEQWQTIGLHRSA